MAPQGASETMADQDRRASKIVADGHQRARSALEPVIRAEVEQESAEELPQFSLWRRLWVRRKMEREIKRRMAAAAPPDALY